MITLSSDYQFIGRSNSVRAYGSEYYYYILLYAKTAGDETTGRHTVTVKMRMACSHDATFYGYLTDGSLTIDGAAAIAWQSGQIPAEYWGDSSQLVEDGVTYWRWVDLVEGTVEVDTAYADKAVEIAATWQRLALDDTPPNWLPSTTKAVAGVTVLLPALNNPEEPDPEEPEPGPDPAPVELPRCVQVYADGLLAYDSRMEDYDLDGLKITNGLNLGGMAEIIMPLAHPAYYFFTSYRTIVKVYRDGKLRFRGRALYPSENFYGTRTITCEGELCLFRDGISRPYLYTDTPAKVFAAVVEDYNSQVEEFKQFRVGTVTVVDENDYIRLESESAETSLDTLNKLLERCGGYFVFTDAEDGTRVINWYATLSRKSRQEIEFGENLLDYTSTGANTTGLATGLVPYGAKDEETGKRLTIESVNDGRDYIMAEDARALRGTIMTTATWDDVTEPANLLRKAQEYLASCKVFITSLELSALDLSYLDKTLDSFSVGDNIRVKSAPHGVDEDFQLTQMTEDLLDPSQSSIVMGKSVQSLTGSDVAGDSKGMSALEAVRVEIIADYTRNVQQVAADIERTIYSRFEQDLQGIVLEMSDSFVTRDNVTSMVEQTTTAKLQTTTTAILQQVAQTYTTKDEHLTLSSRVETLAGSISLEVSGTLGDKATIVMKADDKTYSKDLDLSKVRQAFANDTSEVVIAAGTITFNSGTIVINSDNFRVTKEGKLYATDAVVYGDIITIDGSYKTEMDRGSLRLYFSDVLCGTINTKYWSGASTEGISLRVEEGGNYIMFSHADDTQGSGYVVDYYLNAGWSSNYEEMHIFQTSARFLDGLYVSGPARIRSLRLFGADGEYLVGINSNGGLSVSKL